MSSSLQEYPTAPVGSVDCFVNIVQNVRCLYPYVRLCFLTKTLLALFRGWWLLIWARVLRLERVVEAGEVKMSAEEADKTTTTDASAGDEEEEWLYGGQWAANLICIIVLLLLNSNSSLTAWLFKFSTIYLHGDSQFRGLRTITLLLRYLSVSLIKVR